MNGANAKEQLLVAIGALQGLQTVEEIVKSKLVSDAELLEKIPNYLLDLGGKRMRPALCLLVAKTLGMNAPTQSLFDVSAGIELIHMATLLHDDIIDNSPLRRHKESPYRRFGLPATLLAGDFLLVRAFSLCARLDRAIIDATEVACIELTEGEILETPLHSSEHSLESSLTIARKKTAALFRLASFSAAHIAAPGEAKVIEHLTQFGELIGIAFQILDDILDVTADEQTLGKQSGIDIRERKPSAINVLWLQSNSLLAKNLLEAPDENEDQFVADALKELRSSAVVTEANALARSYAERAREELNNAASAAHESDTVQWDETTALSLEALINYTLERIA